MIRDTYRRLRSSLVRRLIPLAAAAFGRWSWTRVQRFGQILGGIYWRLGRRDRTRTLEHLRLAFPTAEETNLETVGRRCFRHLAMSGCEYLHLLRRPSQETAEHLDIEGWEHVASARGAPSCRSGR